MNRTWMTMEGNEAVARVAYALSDVIAIYPITPSTPMGESADAWQASGQANLWGTVPRVIEMQSEGGAAGVLHGALQTGALATTFTASQGLLLMIPNMYKIAGELTPAVFHVAARALATQGLSIFGDHSDVMATRATGFAQLASRSVQEAQDLALIAHVATLQARVPFLHFFDGFRTSHEINKIELIGQEEMRAMIDETLVQAHRNRALSPEHPFIRGTAQNPDVYFQARESVNPFYQACPSIVQQTMNRFASLTGRQYHLFDYVGAPDAERVIVAMGSGAETVEKTVKELVAQGEKVGVLTVHLFRPFSVATFLQALPQTTRVIAVLDRTKEPGSAGEPLYLDVVAALHEGSETGRAPKKHFTIGITDDVTHTSLAYDAAFTIAQPGTVQCVFWGLGSDGTVGANKNSIKIIGEETENAAQGYFVYDSKKSGSVTISHLRFGPRPLHAPYLIGNAQADFVACHQFALLERFDVLQYARAGGTFLLDSLYGPDQVWAHLPGEIQQTILDKHLRVYVINAHQVAQETNMGGRINTVMQTCFFALSGVLPKEQAIAQIKHSIEKTYKKRGDAVVQRNFQAVDATLAHLHEVPIPTGTEVAQGAGVPRAALSTGRRLPVPLPMLTRRPPVSPEAPLFVREVLAPMIVGDGDQLPVSALPNDGTYPSGTARFEKRNIATEIPVWDPSICIQCGKCVMVCPHAVIREKVYDPALLAGAPASFQAMDAHFKEFPGQTYSLQTSPEDCTGCALCVAACPVKNKSQVGLKALNMAPQPPLREQEVANWDFFQTLPDVDPTHLNLAAIKNSQLLPPLFEFSGACSGCGETPYIKLATQLFGDRMLVANATGCSSIYGGNLPTTPWTSNREGRGPAWSDSLFEDNAEFGLGMRIALDKQQEYACELLARCSSQAGDELARALLQTDQTTEAGIRVQRDNVALLQQRLHAILREKTLTQEEHARVVTLLHLADALVRRSVWIIGGDGWAYDIGFGQASKSTPRAAVAKFAARGKATPKKDLGLLAMAYGSVYVAHVALGANDQQTLHAFQEAEAYDGPSLIIAYSHCIAHGIEMSKGLEQQKLAVQTGYWPLYRYNPALAEEGNNPFTLDSKAPALPLETYAYNETRYRMLLQSNQVRAETLMQQATQDVQDRFARYQQMAATQPEPVPAPLSKEQNHA